MGGRCSWGLVIGTRAVVCWRTSKVTRQIQKRGVLHGHRSDLDSCRSINSELLHDRAGYCSQTRSHVEVGLHTAPELVRTGRCCLEKTH